jgi:hypothetical protein
MNGCHTTNTAVRAVAPTAAPVAATTSLGSRLRSAATITTTPTSAASSPPRLLVAHIAAAVTAAPVTPAMVIARR